MKHMTGFAAVACLGLAGCIGVDMDVEVLSDDTGRITGTFEMQRGMYEMAAAGGEGADFCDESDGGTLELTEEKAICRIDRTGSFDELFEEDDDLDIPATVEPLGDGTVRVSIPLDDFADEEMDEMIEDPAMMAMFRPMLEGYTISFSVSGAEIISSNGEISGDGRRATFSIPLTELIDQEIDLPEAFITEVRY